MSARARFQPWFGTRRWSSPMPPPMRLPVFRTEWQPIPDDVRREAAERGYLLPETWPVHVVVEEDAPVAADPHMIEIAYHANLREAPTP